VDYFFFLVENPKGKYKGQKLIKLVKIRIPAKINKTMAVTSEILLVKYKLITTIAVSILNTLSAVPMLGFIEFDF